MKIFTKFQTLYIYWKKVLMDGYNSKKHFISKWYIYDWFINVFFNKSNKTINRYYDKIEHLVNEFDENKEVHEKNIKMLLFILNSVNSRFTMYAQVRVNITHFEELPPNISLHRPCFFC